MSILKTDTISEKYQKNKEFKVKMKLNKLMEARNILIAKANETVPAALAYKLMKCIKASEEEANFYNTKLKELIDTCQERDENGNPVFAEQGVQIKKERVDEFRTKINELDNTEVEMPHINFSIEELAPLTFSVRELYALEDLITGE